MRTIATLRTARMSDVEKDQAGCSVEYALEETKAEARKITWRTVLRIQARHAGVMSKNMIWS